MSGHGNAANLSVEQILQKLKQGNENYLKASACEGDVSPEKRRDTCENGQFPYAIVVTCSDSRVIPEAIFTAGIGELFVIRVAGNVIGDFELGSIEYAADHLGSPLVVVLGHTNCGAVGAAIGGGAAGYIKKITREIKLAIGDEKDSYKACCLNVSNSIKRIEEQLELPDTKVIGAVYHIDDGHVEFME